MPRVGFEPTISVFEQEKTVHALDGAATVIGKTDLKIEQIEVCRLFLRLGIVVNWLQK
jgi:hypothetical protein